MTSMIQSCKERVQFEFKNAFKRPPFWPRVANNHFFSKTSPLHIYPLYILNWLSRTMEAKPWVFKEWRQAHGETDGLAVFSMVGSKQDDWWGFHMYVLYQAKLPVR